MNAEQKKLQRLTSALLNKGGYTQVRLAKDMGVTQMTISRWYNSPPVEPKAHYMNKLQKLHDKVFTKEK